MMKRKTFAYLAATLILATAAPAVTPAMPAQAASYVQAEQTAAPLSQTVVSAKFVKKNGKTYCLNTDGTQKTGWVKESGKWYYFDKKSGQMTYGWLFLGNRKFFLRKSDGSMVQGPGWYKIGGKKYCFTNNGHVIAAWKKEGGKWYYRNTEGVVIKSRWILHGGRYYYLTKSGAMATGTVTISGKKYTFSSSGDLLGNIPDQVVAAAKAYAREAKASQKASKQNFIKYTKKLAAAANKSSSSSSKTTANTSNTANTKNTNTTNTNTTNTANTSTATKNTNTTSSSSSSSAAKTAGTAAVTKVVGKLNNVSESRRKFVINIATYVRKYAPKYGVLVYSPIIAQAIHESGWGESSLAYKYHNYFGLKCGTLWTGKSVNLSTKEEYTAGTLTTIRDNFRVYDNMEQGVKGYFEFLFNNRTRYNNLKGVTNPRTYLQNIKNDGYATGSLYVDHTMTVLTLYNLTQFDK